MWGGRSISLYDHRWFPCLRRGLAAASSEVGSRNEKKKERRARGQCANREPAGSADMDDLALLMRHGRRFPVELLPNNARGRTGVPSHPA